MKCQSPVPKRSRADVMKNDFFAPPWWRWQRAVALATRPVRQSSRWTDDPMTLAAVAFIRSRACGSPREELARNHLPFGEAQSIFDDNGITRWSVEAYTLTGLPANAIADKLGLEPEVIRVYEHFMFDVRPRLSARDWIGKHNYGVGTPTGFEADHLGPLWRWVGYTAGEYALDAVRAVTTGVGTENYSEVLCESIERFVALTQFLAVCTPGELFRLHHRLRARQTGAPAWVDVAAALPTRSRGNNRRSHSSGSPDSDVERDRAPLNSSVSYERDPSDARWETRGDESHYCTSVTINGKQRRVSLGTGIIGRTHELLDTQELRQQQQQSLSGLEDAA